MDFVNPPKAFVWFDGVMAPRLLARVYRDFANRITLSGSEDVLEFGCGSGGVAERLMPRLPDGSLTAADISPPMVRIAERRLKQYTHARCLVGPIESLELKDAAFDLVVIHNALHDVVEAERIGVVNTLARLLRPGGSVCLREPTKPSHGMAPAAIRELFAIAGFREVRFEEHKAFVIGPVVDAIFATPS